MKVNKKPFVESSIDSSDWVFLALEAIKLSFDENEQLDFHKKENHSKSISLFESSFNYATEAWPFIKCADIYTDQYKKIDLYEKSFQIEKTEIACVKLLELNINNNNLIESKKWLNELKSINFKNPNIKKFICLNFPLNPTHILFSIKIINLNGIKPCCQRLF